ncbi:hypothetical protein M5D96_013291, partial [Drosophila gunungcola]
PDRVAAVQSAPPPGRSPASPSPAGLQPAKTFGYRVELEEITIGNHTPKMPLGTTQFKRRKARKRCLRTLSSLSRCVVSMPSVVWYAVATTWRAS